VPLFGSQKIHFYKDILSIRIPILRLMYKSAYINFVPSPLPSRYCYNVTVTHRDSPWHTVTSTLPTVSHRFLSFFHRFLAFRTIISFAWIFWKQEIRKTLKIQSKIDKINNKYILSVFSASYGYFRNPLVIIMTWSCHE